MSPFFLQKMISENRVKQLVEEKIKDTDLFLVDVKVGGGNRISVSIDHKERLNVGDCAEVSRYVEHNLDREKEDFEITVSSPGLDQPLKVLKQFYKNTGRNVRVITKEGVLVRGKLIGADEQGIKLEKFAEKKKKQKGTNENEILNLNYTELKETKLEITFK